MDNQQLLNRIERLEREVKLLRELHYKNNFSGVYVETRDLSHTGWRAGFYSLPPIPQPSSTGETSGSTDVVVLNTTSFNGNVGSTFYTVLDIVKHLKNLGLIKK